jgi:DNA-binding transcriptional ArsR family regulator
MALTDTERLAIGSRYRDGESIYQLAEAYRVSPQAITYHLRQQQIPRRHPGGLRTQCPISVERLSELYLREGLSMRQIGRLLDVPMQTVGGWLRRFAIPRRASQETQHLMTDRGDLPRYRFTEQDLQRAAAGYAQWRESHPDEFRELCHRRGKIGGRRRCSDRRPLARPCAWCGNTVVRLRSETDRTSYTCCGRSHHTLVQNHNRWHFGEPRPLILDRLRAGESGIGETDAETDELRLEQMLAAREAA